MIRSFYDKDGVRWLCLQDLKDSLIKDETILHAFAMLKVSLEKKRDPLDAMRRAIGYVIADGLGDI